MSETVQWIIVIAAIAGAVIAAVRLFSSKSADGCAACELKESCKKRELSKRHETDCAKNRHENLQNKK